MITMPADYITKNDLDEALDRFAGRMETVVRRVVGEEIGDVLTQLIKGLDTQFAGIDKRFEGIDKQFAVIDQRFDKMDQRFDRVDQDIKDLATITMRIDNRLGDTVETVKVHDAQIRQVQRKLA